MSTTLPSFQFYPGDWIKDPRLGQCSAQTRGIWIDLICAGWENDRSGVVMGTVEGLAQACRCKPGEMGQCLRELRETDTAHVSQDGEIYTVVNRRIHREYLKRTGAAERKRRSRGKKNGENIPDLPVDKSVDKSVDNLWISGMSRFGHSDVTSQTAKNAEHDDLCNGMNLKGKTDCHANVTTLSSSSTSKPPNPLAKSQSEENSLSSQTEPQKKIPPTWKTKALIDYAENQGIHARPGESFESLRDRCVNQATEQRAATANQATEENLRWGD